MTPGQRPDPADAFDLKDLMPVDSTPPPTPPRKLVYPLMWDDELDDLQQQEWLIDGILPAKGLNVLYGEPGIGKTFIAIDWALSIAEGVSCHGRKVQQAPVVYVCAEGWLGVRNRVSAWKLNNDVFGENRSGVAFLGKGIRLMDPLDIPRFGDSVEATGVQPGLIVIDTLARNAVGMDEVSAKDMGQVVSSCDALRERFDSAVLLLHHPSKALNPTLRGSGALSGAADAVALVKRDGDKIALISEKMKEAQPFKRMTFRIAPCGNSAVLLLDGKNPKKLRQEDVFIT